MTRLLLLLLLLVPATTAEVRPVPPELDRLPVLHQGRIKPFAIAAGEIVNALTTKRAFGPLDDAGRLTARPWQPVPLVAAILRDPAAWRAVPMLHTGAEQLRTAQSWQEWITYDQAAAVRAQTEMPRDRLRVANATGERIELSDLDTAWKNLGERLDELEALFTGGSLGLAPLAPDAAARAWVLANRDRLTAAEGAPPGLFRSLHGLARMPAGLTDETLSGADLWIDLGDAAMLDRMSGWPGPGREIAAWMSAVRTGDAAALAVATPPLADALRAWGSRRDDDRLAAHQARLARGLDSSSPAREYPSARIIDVELTYHRIGPFTWAWICFIAGGLLAAFGLRPAEAGGRRPGLLTAGLVLTGLACLITTAGLGARVAITGMGAVGNLYETLIWVALLVGGLGAFYAVRTGQGVYAVAGGVGAGLCAMIGEAIPPEYGSSIGQLQPVLRSQFWLWTHVKVVVGAYAPFTLAWVLANIVLARAAFGGRAVSGGEQQLIYRCLQVGVVLMTLGTILGAIWADQAWGRYWGWDPKEVYALVVILVYLVPLHLRYVGVVGPSGLAVWAILGFLSVVMSWYGVNFLLGVGKHAYAFGNGGQLIVLPLCALQVVWVVVLYARVAGARVAR
jgi:ABC-type transport system involved in cytochrome c biogenesis permease subunit